jgi:hypothetical protein
MFCFSATLAVNWTLYRPGDSGSNGRGGFGFGGASCGKGVGTGALGVGADPSNSDAGEEAVAGIGAAGSGSLRMLAATSARGKNVTSASRAARTVFPETAWMRSVRFIGGRFSRKSVGAPKTSGGGEKDRAKAMKGNGYRSLARDARKMRQASRQKAR